MTIKEAIKKSGSTTFMFGSHIKAAETKLQAEEDVLFAITANISTTPVCGNLNPELTIKNKNAGVVVFTNKRIYFCQSILGSSKYKEIYIKDIQSVDSVKTLGIAQLRICGITDMFVIDINKKILSEAEKILSEMRTEFINESNSLNNTKRSENLDDLRKIKTLFDDGIITQEEFDAKKKQLLGL